MGFQIKCESLNYGVKSNPSILGEINIDFQPGQFVAVLGENGAGKTTLLDLLMGFRKPTSGSILIENKAPSDDPWELRKEIAYLSEKVDIPGDWSAREFLNFNKFFYKNYSDELEKDLCKRFRVNDSSRLGNMSAGEIRRVQVVGALASKPKMIIVDEITAVLDIVGRRRFMKILSALNTELNCTVIIATNILEDLENYVSHVLLLRHGKEKLFQTLNDFMGEKDKAKFSQVVADILEDQ